MIDQWFRTNSDSQEVSNFVSRFSWEMPSKPVCFLTDLHADPVAFLRSLYEAGLIEPMDYSIGKIVLTDKGKITKIIIGGDLLDKGPSNLSLLGRVKELATLKDVKFLAGNHDIRNWMGLMYLDHSDPTYSFFFSRLGKRIVPLLLEIKKRHFIGNLNISPQTAEKKLFLSEDWQKKFYNSALGKINHLRLLKEMNKAPKKVKEMKRAFELYGLSIEHAYNLILSTKYWLLSYKWLWNEMDLLHIDGSFLFAHAGINDTVIDDLYTHGPDYVNDFFRSGLYEDPFVTYHGPYGNVFQTKYRDVDYELTQVGIDKLFDMGVYAIVHGHQNARDGHRAMIRKGILNIECDCAIDALTREHWDDKVPTAGYASLEIRESKLVGRSADHKEIKVLELS